MKIIGRTDIVSFPSIGIYYTSAKIDTGAFTSSLHCESVELIEDDVLRVDFGDGNIQYFDDYDSLNVTSSNGQGQMRYAIVTKIEVFGELLPIKLTLSNRSSMKNECLIGRTFLSNNKILVYVREQNLSIKNIKPLFGGLYDFRLYMGDQYQNFNSIEDLLIGIMQIMFDGQEKMTDFGKASYSRRMKSMFIINKEIKITLDKLVTFVSEYKKGKKKFFYLEGIENYISKDDDIDEDENESENEGINCEVN